MTFLYDKPMRGDGHATDKVCCPNCQGNLFQVYISNDMQSFWVDCITRGCGYTTRGIGSLQFLLEDRLRAVIKYDQNQKGASSQ